jgi:putative FmdB family regulatory protein
MPLYAYRCPECSDFEVSFDMGRAPADMQCPACKTSSPRRFTAPHLSRAASSAYRLIESTQRSASEPAVVSSPGPATPGAAGPVSRNPAVSTNPLHRKLPRPE